MKRARKNIDELGAYSDLLLYAIVLSFVLFFIAFHSICAFVITGFMTHGFADEWSSVLTMNIKDWSLMRWTIGIPLILFCVQYFRLMKIEKSQSFKNIFHQVVAIEAKDHPDCVIHEILDLNGNRYLDLLYAETFKMCERANITMPKLFYVSTDDLNAYTTTAEDGTSAIVLLEGLMEFPMSFMDVKAIVAHEIGHIISKDVTYSKFIGCAIGVMTSCWICGQILVKVKAKELMHPPGGRDADPMQWLLGVGALVLGDIMILLGGFTNYCAMAIKWLRDKQAEFLADSRGARLLDDEQNFADMIIMMHCKAAIKSSSRGFCFNANKNSIEVRSLMAPGQKFGDIDVHPNDVERVRRLRPSFNGNFREAFLEVVSKRSKGN